MRVGTASGIFACVGMDAVRCARCWHPPSAHAQEFASARAGRPRPYEAPGIPGIIAAPMAPA